MAETEEDPVERERMFRSLFKMMADKDPELLKDESDDYVSEFIDRELEEKKGDRIYFACMSIAAMADTISLDIPLRAYKEDMIEAGYLDVCAGFGRFALAVLDKENDPFSGIEQAAKAAVSMAEYFKAKKIEWKVNS